MALVDVALSHPVSPPGCGCGWSRRHRLRAGRCWPVTHCARSGRWRTAGLTAGPVRALEDLELNDLLVELPVDRFDALLDADFPTEGAAA
jgi:hypothetical protein